MPDSSKHIDQQEELNKILADYDSTTRNLYNEILKLYSEQGLQMSKAAIITEIKDRVKEAAK